MMSVPPWSLMVLPPIVTGSLNAAVSISTSPANGRNEFTHAVLTSMFVNVPAFEVGELSVAVVPALTMLMNLSGLIGGAVVFLSLDFPLVTYMNRIVEATTAMDLLQGLFKGMAFGIVVAAVGCMRGMQTGTGAGAVGESTTSSVVSGIILIAVADGVFAVLFYVLGI